MTVNNNKILGLIESITPVVLPIIFNNRKAEEQFVTTNDISLPSVVLYKVCINTGTEQLEVLGEDYQIAKMKDIADIEYIPKESYVSYDEYLEIEKRAEQFEQNVPITSLPTDERNGVVEEEETLSDIISKGSLFKTPVAKLASIVEKDTTFMKKAVRDFEMATGWKISEKVLFIKEINNCE